MEKTSLGTVSPTSSATDQRASATADSVSFVVHHHIRAGAQAAYEAWLVEIMQVAAAFPGHQGVQVIRPAAGGVDYTIIVKFATYGDATRWHQSIERTQLLETVQPQLTVAEQVSIGAGIDYWFQPVAVATGGPPMKPPAWKQWLITTSVIWPLTMVVPWVLGPIFQTLPALGTYGVKQGILASVIVALVVWVIMPRYTRLVHDWLFRKA